MQQGFPITIKFDSRIEIDQLMKVAASKLEMWINFAALKNGWYADEDCVLEIEFILLEAQSLNQLIEKHANSKWQIEENQQFAFIHDRDNTQVDGYIAIDTSNTDYFEAKLKTAITTVANLIIEEYNFITI